MTSDRGYAILILIKNAVPAEEKRVAGTPDSADMDGRMRKMEEIRIERNPAPKQKPDENHLVFGRDFTDHMFVMDWNREKGWYDPRIVPYGPLSLSPACNCLHYGQETFEGMKAYRCPDGTIRLFRPEENFKRLNSSNDRLSMPQLDVDFALKALKTLIELDADWVPHKEGTSLYIRPFVIGTEPSLGAHTSSQYKFIIILSPVGAYYASGLNPVKIYVENEYVRAVRGGMGYAKTGGNYAASMKAQDVAAGEGFSQVLWLDGVERKYIEEVGAMNVFFVLGDEVVTPALQGSILPGITRKSVIELLKSWGMKVSERRLSIDELEDAYREGRFTEMFGSGTAAVISPVGLLRYQDMDMELSDGKIGPLSQKLYDELTGIQWGIKPDPFGWSVKVL